MHGHFWTKDGIWCFCYLLFPHLTGLSPERLSTYFTTFVRIVIERAESFKLSIPALDAMVKLLLELVVLVRRIISLFGNVFSDKFSVLWELRGQSMG